MTKIKRWNLPFDFGGVEMEVSSGGNYVRYDDHLAALSTLRARVAELEARATPQAGVSEAEPVAIRDFLANFPGKFCVIDVNGVNTDDPLIGKYIWIRTDATPPDSDAVRALRECIKQLDAIIEDGTPADFRVWRDDLHAALSNQGSSSNG